MHELAIAEGVLGIVERHAEGRRVRTVELRVGQLRQVVPGALTLAFDLVAAGTVAEGARIELESVPVIGRCRMCEAESALDELPLTCRACGGWDIEVVQGEELQVQALELDEERTMSPTAGRGRHAR